MPRVSNKTKNLKELRNFILFKSIQAQIAKRNRHILLKRVAMLQVLYEEATEQRYLYPRSYVRRLDTIEQAAADVFLWDPEQFKREFRMEQVSFWGLHALIKEHPVYRSTTKRQTAVEFQMLVVLQRFGKDGNGSSYNHISLVRGSCVGNVAKYTERFCEALQSLKESVIFWPDAAERRVMASEIEELGYFPQCVGFIDGTLFPLETKPVVHGEDYFGRKSNYSVTGFVICDHERRVRYLYVGWPGSVHDARVLNNSHFGRNMSSYFSPGEYIIGDSAYASSKHIVPPFKKPTNRGMPPTYKRFNEMLARIRISVEHTFGVAKGRFPVLKRLRIRISGKKSMTTLISIVEACFILHNLMITAKDSFSEEDFDNEGGSGEDETLRDSLSGSGGSQTTMDRRNQLLQYFMQNNLLFP